LEWFTGKLFLLSAKLGTSKRRPQGINTQVVSANKKWRESKIRNNAPIFHRVSLSRNYQISLLRPVLTAAY